MLKRSPWRSLATASLFAALAVMQACSSTDSDPATGSILLSVAPTGATVQQGGTTVVAGTLTRSDFTGSVAITVEGAPSGATGTVVLTGSSAVVSISTTSATLAGAYPLTVRAKGAGLTLDATASFMLTVAAASNASYTTTLGTPALSIALTGSNTSSITLVRTNFTGSVALSIDNLPTGVTASFSPNPATALSATLTLNVLSTAAVGVYNLVVRGTSVGVTDVTAPLALTVTATGFSILATPAARTIAQGATNGVGGVKATRLGAFAGTITYSLAGAPAGVTAAFATTTVTDSMQVTLTATSAVTAGTYTTLIHGISGTTDQVTPLSIIVTVPAGSVRLDYSACLAASKPVWLAMQDGTGAWTRLTATGDVYTFVVTSTKGGLTYVVPNGTGFKTTVVYKTQAEWSTDVGGCVAVPSTQIVNGSVTGLLTNDVAKMSLGGSTASPVTNTTFILPTVIAGGTFDLLGYRRNTAAPGVLDKGLIRRDQTIASGGTLAVADFTSATEAFAAATANLTVTGGGAGDALTQSMSYLTGAACTSNGLYSVATGNATTFAMFGVAASAQRSTDFHSMQIIDAAIGGSRILTVNFHTMADRSISFGALLSAAVTNVTGAVAYKRLQAVLTLPLDYTFALLGYNDAASNTITVSQSAAYLAGSQAVTLAMPDLTGAAGLTTTWFPLAASATSYTVTAANLPTTACAEGATTKFATATGTN